MIDRLSRLTPSGLRVIPAPIRAIEATRAVAEAADVIFPSNAPLVSPVVLADAGPIGGAAGPPAVVAQSTLTVVVFRRAQQSARAAGVRLEKIG